MLIARLIADADGHETRLESLAKALADAGMAAGVQIGSKALAEGKAIAQLRVDHDDHVKLREVMEAHLVPDSAFVTASGMEALTLFVSDMDSTMIEQECIDELADFAGIKDEVSAITERAMQGELDFETSLRQRVRLLAGIDESAIAECLTDRIVLMSGARVLVQTLKAKGVRTVLVTGGFHHFADPIADKLGFDRVVANRLEVKDGKLTGGLVGPIADGRTKLAILEEERSKLGAGRVLATGDGANDVPMLQAADYGFAYKAKKTARDAASGWIDHGDLTAILDLFDIPEGERAG